MSRHPCELAFFVLCASLLGLAQEAATQEVRLLRQVFPRTGSDPDASPRRFVALGSHVYSATDVGLVRCDAAGRSPRQVVPTATEVVVSGGRLFLLADGVAVSDGTRAGTRTVYLGSPQPELLTPLRGDAVFVADTRAEGRELWITDGSIANTRIVSDIRPGAAGSSPRALTLRGQDLFFAADDGVRGEELWLSDGTAAGTRLVADVRPGTAGSSIEHMVAGLSRVWFFAADGAGGSSLWYSDGTAPGTVKVAAAVPDPTLTPFGNGVIYLQTRGGRIEVWQSDGTAAGTVRVADAGQARNQATGIRPAVVGGYWYFAVPDAAGDGELWRSDGTAAGTVALTRPGHLPAGSVLEGLGVQVFFAGGLGTAGGVELWSTDGTVAGTRLVRDLHPTGSSMPGHLTSLFGRLWMAADDGRYGVEPWVSDGTAAGTRLVGNVATFGDRSEVPLFPAVADDDAWFIQDRRTSALLWHTDGTSAGTTAVAIPPHDVSISLRKVMIGAGRAFFAAPSPANAQVLTDLWVTDGTAAGTRLFRPGIGVAQDMVDLGTVALFGAGAYGEELWRTDGTVAGTVRLGTNQLYPWGRMVVGSRFERVGQRAWFIDGMQQLAVTDGSLAGTRVVAATTQYRMTSEPVRFGDRLAFLAVDQMVLTDGTPAGTTTVPMRASGVLQGPVAMEATSRGIFVLLMNSRFGSELWFTDGVTARQLVEDRTFLPTSGHVFGDRFYFSWYTPASGVEPWVSDGTQAGTYMLKDIEAGPESSGGGIGIVTGSRYVYFRASQDLEPRLFRSDGTAAGTVPLPSGPPAVSHPLAQVGGRLVFIGQDPDLGYQPFVVELFANGKTVGHGCAAGARVPLLGATDPVLGGQVRLTLQSPHVIAGAVVLLGLPSSFDRYVRLPGGCVVLPDVSLPTLAVPLQTGRTGEARLDVPLPNLPSLIGVRVYAQAAVGATANPPLGTDLTPGVSLTLGR